MSSEPFIRATLAHEQSRADLLLPAHLPVAELLPSLVRHFVTMNPRTASRGFVLTLADGTLIDQGRSLRSQNIDDGSLLLLTPRVKKIEKKYDDLVEAIADVVNETNKPWTPADAANLAMGASVTLLIATTILLTQARPSGGIVVPIILGLLAVFLTGVTWVLERGERHNHAVSTAMLVSLTLAGCGWTIPPFASIELPLALAGLGSALGAAITMTLVTQWRELMLAPGISGISLGAVGAANMTLAAQHERVAVVATGLLGLLLLALPHFSLKVSHLEEADPLLSPKEKHISKDSGHPIDPSTVHTNYIHGRRTLFAARCGVGLALTCLAPLTVSTGPWGVVVIAGILLILTLNTRTQYARLDVLCEYIIAVSIFTVTCLSVMITQPSWWLGLVIALALIAASLIAYGLVIGQTPQWARNLANVGETIAGLILIPAVVLALRLW